jgi:integrase
MAEVRFTLRNKYTEGKTVILLSFNYGEQRLRLSTGISTYVKDWDFKRQRFIENKDYPELQEFNLHIDLLAKQVANKYNEFLVHRRIPNAEEFKHIIQSKFLLKKPREEKNHFWSLFDDFVKEKVTQVKDVTDYDLALRKHLIAASATTGTDLTFSFVKQRAGGFVHIFEDYMRNEAINLKGHKGLSTNTIGKQLKNLKVFLRWCFDNGHVETFSTSHLVTYSEEVDAVYLTEDELQLLESIHLSDELSIIRDLFLVGCETGLRFGDYVTIENAYINGNNLEVIPQKMRTKTKQQHLIIPISKRFQRILEKHENKLPHFDEHRLHLFNVSLRNICREANINSLCNFTRLEHNVPVQRQFEKWELISSHTARRTFCTLKYLAGMPSESIMKFSGHTSERNFLKYLRLDYQLNADHFRQFF